MSNPLIIEINSQDLCLSVELSEAVLIDIIEHGIISPLFGENVDTWIFHANVVNVIKKATRIRRDLEIEWQAVALVLELLQQRDFLLQENAMLKQRLSRFIAED